MTMVKIEPPNPADIPAILEMIRAKARFDQAEHLLQLDQATLAAALFSERPSVSALLARSSDGLVGIATYYRIYSTFLRKLGYWLDDLFVIDAQRGKGVGRALLKALCERAIDEDCARIDWIVAKENHSAQEFYRAFGAEIFESVRHARFTADKIAAIAAGGLASV
jgi:GNAT superfamily N-acetyltransferase